MDKIILALKSRTVWTTILNLVVMLAPVLPPAWKDLVGSVLALLAIYFHVSPSQSYPQQ